jgi:DNA invertase Pin-like site-specific DNA recombinase
LGSIARTGADGDRCQQRACRERTRAGLKATEAHGRRGGRKPVVTEEKLRRARDLIAKGLTTREAAPRIKVGKIALCKALHPLP